MRWYRRQRQYIQKQVQAAQALLTQESQSLVNDKHYILIGPGAWIDSVRPFAQIGKTQSTMRRAAFWLGLPDPMPDED